MRIVATIFRVLCLAILLNAGIACSRNEKRLPVFPVHGQVFYEGRKCSGAVVIFHPVAAPSEKVPLPRARADAEGRFRLSTYGKDDGAPAGDYSVVIEWKTSDLHPEQGTDLLPERYGDAKTSPLKATVKSEATELAPFKLTR